MFKLKLPKTFIISFTSLDTSYLHFYTFFICKLSQMETLLYIEHPSFRHFMKVELIQRLSDINNNFALKFSRESNS